MSGFIQLGDAELSVAETDSTVTIPITRTGDTSQAVVVEYRIDNDTATAGSDYTASTGVVQTVTIPAGATTASVVVPILDDGLSEATESFSISLINVSSGALLAPRTSRVNILDDENPVDPPTDPPLVSDYEVTLEPVLSAGRPIDIRFSPADPSIAYVARKPGIIETYDITTGEQLSTFANFADKTNSPGDRGLMSIELHPDFENNPYVYAFYVVDPPETAGQTGLAGPDGQGNRFAYLSRFTASSDLVDGKPFLTVEPGSEVVLVGGAATSLSDISGNGAINSTSDFSIPASDVDPDTGEYIQDFIKLDSTSHAGGGLAFGPDGMLYATIGDGTSFNFADERTISVQSVDALAGKVIRIDPITGNGLTDNPFYDGSGDLTTNSSKVYQMGLRNPFRAGFDENGRLFISETGWSTYEEINSGGPGANFGWPFYEGSDLGVNARNQLYTDLLPAEAAAFDQGVADGNIELTAPFRAFHHLESEPGFQFSAIVGGGAFISGPNYPEALDNHYLFTDFVNSTVFSVDSNDRTDLEFLYSKPELRTGPVQFMNGPDGYVYVIDLLGDSINRLIIEDPDGPPPPPPPPPTGDVFIRWNAGDTTVLAADGGPDWTPDPSAVTGGILAGGNASSLDSSAPAGTPLGLYSQRYWDPAGGVDMALAFGGGALASGTYTVRLYTGSTAWAGTDSVGDRVFDISIEGALAFDNFDPVAAFGHSVGGVLEWQGSVTDGTVNIDFGSTGADVPNIHGVEIIEADGTPPPPPPPPPDDDPTVSLSATPGSATEGPGASVTVTVTASAAVSGAQSVALGVSGVSAADFLDPIPTSLTIADGATTASVTLRVNDDALVEGTETAVFSISAPSAGIDLGATTTDSFTIFDNDDDTPPPPPPPPPTGATLVRWNAGDATFAASDGGPDWTPDPSAVTGGILAGGNASSLDSSAPAGTPLGLYSQRYWDPAGGVDMALAFGGGALASGTYTVRLFTGSTAWAGTDSVGDRVFDISIEGALAFDNFDPVAAFGHSVGGVLEWQGSVTDGTVNIDFGSTGADVPNIHGVEIIEADGTPPPPPPPPPDDDPTVTLSATPGSATEGPGASVTVTVTASAAVSGAQSVALGVSGVSAADFLDPIPTSLTIADGATTASVTLRVNDDALVEGTETAVFSISAPSAGIDLGATTSDSFTIFDNDDDTPPPPPPPSGDVFIRWNAGDATFAASDGGPTWTPDPSAVTGGLLAGGNASSLDASVPAGTPIGIYSQRYWDPGGGGDMALVFGDGALASGDYIVRLYTGSTAWVGTDSVGDRVFDISVEGDLAFNDFDPVAAFGHSVGGVLEWQGSVTDGTVNIDFASTGADVPNIHAIEIIDNFDLA